MNTARRINDLYQQHSRRVQATLIRLLGDFDLAEEATQEAFTAALKQWPEQGIPENPGALTISAVARLPDITCRALPRTSPLPPSQKPTALMMTCYD